MEERLSELGNRITLRVMRQGVPNAEKPNLTINKFLKNFPNSVGSKPRWFVAIHIWRLSPVWLCLSC